MARAQEDHAVVLGASMAGLLAARVLSESFGAVTVIERDVLPAGAAQRRGVPQGRHLHALLCRGGQVLDDLFPGLTKQVAEAGAPVGDLLGNIRWFLSGYRLAQADIGQPVLFASRPMLEAHVRSLVKDLGGVSFLDGCDIAGPAVSRDKRRVTGVRVRAGGAAEDVVDADLVVDATGRGSRAPVWLEELGYGRPAAEKVTVEVAYASRSYRLPPGILGKDRLIMNVWTPDSPRAAGLVEQGDGRFLLTAAGSSETTRRPIRRASTSSSRGCGYRTSARRSAPACHQTIRSRSGIRRTYGCAMNRCGTSPTASSSSGTRYAPSTRSTARA